MNSTTQNSIQRYKECAGKGCQERGIHFLKIQLINKFAWFCDSCKSNLIAEHLVIEEDIERLMEND